MSSNEKKLNIKDAINLSSYPLNIRRDFVEFLENTYGSQKHKLYLFSRNETAPKLFLLQMQIPAKFNNQSYDISLLVYFPLNFPEIEPEIFFEKIGKVKINPNCTFYIDEDTLKINYSLFFSWEKSLDSFKSLIAELYNQFNIAFPVFNLSDKHNFDTDKGSDQSDCVLKKNLCKEIELIKPSKDQKKTLPNAPNNIYQNNNNNPNNNYNNYNKDMNNKMNNMNNEMNNMNLNNNNNNKVNIYGRKMNNNDNNMNNNYNKMNNNNYNMNNNNNNNNMNNFRNNDFNNYNRNMNNNNNNINPFNNNMNNNNNNNFLQRNLTFKNNNNYGNNQMMNMNQNNNPPVFDENKAKAALIVLLKNNLSQKINNAIQPITSSYLKLEKIKENIIKKINDYNKVESKENAIRQTINTLHKEMDFTITSPKGIDRPDLNNLESVLIISNKDFYLRLAKEKAIEEYILVVKKSYEKQNIDFNTALNLIRTNSRNIFFLKYKNANPFGY